MKETDKILTLKVVGNVTTSFSEAVIKDVLSPFMIISFIEISSTQSEGSHDLV